MESNFKLHRIKPKYAEYIVYCYSGTQASSGGVRFDPELVTSQLNDIMDEDLLSDDDFFSNTSSEGICGCGKLRFYTCYR